MAESPRRLDLRLTIPAAVPYRPLAVELVERFAAYAGAGAADAKRLARDVEASVESLGGGPQAPIALDIAAADGEVVVTAQSGSATKRTTCPLPD